MKILYLCHRLPNAPDKGCKIRAYHELRALGARHEVHLLTLADRPEDLGRTEALEAFCDEIEVFPVHRPTAYLRCLAQAPRSIPSTLAFFHSRALWRRCRELAETRRYDVVVAYSSAMAPYAEVFSETPRVLDMVDVDSAKWDQYACLGPRLRRPVYGLEARRLRAFEARVARRSTRVVLATGQERDLLADIAPEARAVSIPNGIDLSTFRPLDLPRSRRPLLAFTGQMDYFPNVDAVVTFVRDALPALQRRFPELQMVIVGRSPTAAVRALADRPGVTVTGAVEDVRPFLARSWAFVAPLRIAQGIQNKVLEAMASRVPVVCTERVLRGLAEGGFRPGVDLLAGAADGLVEPVAELLDSEGRREEIAAAAQERVADAYSWRRSLAAFEDVLWDAAGERGAKVRGRVGARERRPVGASAPERRQAAGTAVPRVSEPALAPVPVDRSAQPLP